MEGNEAEEDADVVELLHPDNKQPHKTTERAILTFWSIIIYTSKGLQSTLYIYCFYNKENAWMTESGVIQITCLMIDLGKNIS